MTARFEYRRLRFNVVEQPKLLKRVEVRLVKAVWRWQRSEPGVTVRRAR